MTQTMWRVTLKFRYSADEQIELITMTVRATGMIDAIMKAGQRLKAFVDPINQRAILADVAHAEASIKE